MKAISLLVLGLVLLSDAALAIFEANTSYSVRVTSFVDSEWKLTRESRVCFDPAQVIAQTTDLENRNVSSEIIKICRLVASEKGIQVVETAEGKCHPIKLEWSKGTEYDVCDGFLNTRCIRHRKQLSMGFSHFDPNQNKVTEIHRVTASMKSTNPTFSIQSAEVLCRGIFQDFPERRVNEVYQAKPVISMAQGF